MTVLILFLKSVISIKIVDWNDLIFLLSCCAVTGLYTEFRVYRAKYAMEEFFIDDDNCDSEYRAIRDTIDVPRFVNAKRHIESLWEQFSPHCTNEKKDKMRRDAAKQLFQHYWEMYLFCTLRNRGIEVQIGSSSGPDFFVHYGQHKLWIEATAPGAGTGCDRVLGPFESSITHVGNIALRFTNALTCKRNQFERAKETGLIGENDGYILAINSRLFGGNWEPYAELPHYLQAFLPIGDLTVPFNKTTGLLEEPYFSYQVEIKKSNDSSVRKDNFLNEDYKFVSAVLHSAANYRHFDESLGFDFSLLHNPMAKILIGQSMFEWCYEQFVVDLIVTRI